MEINVTVLDGESAAPADTRPRRWRLTVDVDAADDPAGHLWGLALADRFTSVLRLYGQGHDVAPADAGDLWGLLVDGGRVTARMDAVMDALMWAARDTHGRSWGEIANATDQGRKSVRNAVERTRTAYAARGYWRDAHGLHKTTPEIAQQEAFSRAAQLAARRSMAGDEVAQTAAEFGVNLNARRTKKGE